MSVTDRGRSDKAQPDLQAAPAAGRERQSDFAATRAELESELRSRIKQREALAQLAERALAEPDLERLLNDAVSTVALTLSVDFVKILELLPGDTELVLRAGFGWKKDMVGSILTTTSANSYARYTLDSAVPVVTDDYAEEKRF